MSTRNPSRKSPRWIVYRIVGARGTTLGVIVAADEIEAVSVACVTFGIEPADRRRIVVRQVVDG